ncbi:MAG TPA: tetratricopeptide repeat protein [Planctomycetota bacterium]|nr:tetratricopeptide repeat protein [Planctomycetota bacterium]
MRAAFEEVVEREGADRASWLETACAGDPELRKEVERLLAADAPSGSLGGHVDPRVLADYLAPAPDLAGARVGDFAIVRRIASGGMGAVYEAVQEKPSRRVALKVLSAGLGSPSALRRFEVETELLGRLRHPGIAQVYAAGTREGIPYYAMELVEGARTLLEHARERGLDAQARVELFLQVLDAVQFAHEKGVIHRDLKPENVLVDAAGRARVIDFGVARVAGAATAHTQAGQLVGTLRWMSPEQVEGDADAVDARSDVYALGLLLHELLAGRAPYDLDGKSLAEVARVIGRDAPAPLGAHARELAGDLEWIVLRALEKDRSRRYATVAELAADLRRHLANEPVLAGPPTAAYRFAKLVRRHRVAFGAGAVVAIALLAAVVGTTTGLVRAKRSEARAVAARDDLQAVLDFVLDMVGAAEPARGGSRITVVDAVRGAEGLASGFGARPAVEAAVRSAMGTLWQRLGIPERAEAHLRAALELRRAADGDDARETHLARLELSITLADERRLADAEALARASWVGFQALGLEEETLSAQICVANDASLAGRHAEARSLAEDALRRRRALSGPEHSKTLAAMSIGAKIAMAAGAGAEAEVLLREALEIRRRVFGDDHPSTLIALNGLGRRLHERGDLDGAEAAFRELLDRRRRLLGDDHPATMLAAHNLATVLRDAKRLEEASPLAEEVAASRARRLGPDDPETLLSRGLVANLLLDRKRFAEAADALREIVASMERALGPSDPATLDAVVSYADALERVGDADESDRRRRAAWETAQASLPAGHWRVGYFGGAYAKGLARRGKLDEAEPLLVASLASLREGLGRRHAQTRSVAKALAALYEKTGRPERAAELADAKDGSR